VTRRNLLYFNLFCSVIVLAVFGFMAYTLINPDPPDRVGIQIPERGTADVDYMHPSKIPKPNWVDKDTDTVAKPQ